MVEHNIKRYVCAIIIVFLISFIAICILMDPLAEGLKGIISAISTGISITAIIAIFFVSHAWKWKIFKGWLVPFPNLNGCWEGCIKYNYDGRDSSRKIKVNIKQTFISIIVNLESKESHSKNFCGSFNIDKKRDERQLIYSYFNEPEAKYRNRSPLHYGTTKLDLASDDKSMKGEYWTNRGSLGSISLKKTK
ncbi:MAG: hypothetical protein ACOX6L_11010 [Syntrophomonadaceae bacterium]|jgi:hypothetical protein